MVDIVEIPSPLQPLQYQSLQLSFELQQLLSLSSQVEI